MVTWKKYWNNKFLGIEIFKLKFIFKKFLYKFTKITLPKLKSQKNYWQSRGTVYMEEFFDSKYESREIFFQNLLIENIKNLNIDSAFEAGCGFGWNIKRLKDEFPSKRIGGLDFSETQLSNGKEYCKNNIDLYEGDICKMPFEDNFFDLGFSVGVFMNIHKSKINDAVKEMVRVSKKYILHLEYSEEYAEKHLIQERKFKTNIISYDYAKLYKDHNVKVKKFLTYKDFLAEHNSFMQNININLQTWEEWEGPSKYILVLIEKQ